MLEEVTGAIKSLAQRAFGEAKEEESPETGSDAPRATGETQPGVPLVDLPMSEKELKEWGERVEEARNRTKRLGDVWKALLKEYLPDVAETGKAEYPRVMKHFRNVHSKIGHLFFETPEVILDPKSPSPADNMMPAPMPMQMPGAPLPPPMPPVTMKDIVAVKQAVLKYFLGRDHINMNRLMDELLFDVLAWAGIGVAKIGYHCVYKSVQTPKMMPPPMAPGAVLGMSAPMEPIPATDPMTGEPIMETSQVCVHEEYYVTRISPMKYLCDVELNSTRHEEFCTFQGFDFYMSPKMAKRVYKLTDEDIASAMEEDTQRFPDHPENQSAKKGKLLHGTELWVKAHHYTDELDPKVQRQLVIFEGMKKPAVWRMSPHQTIDPMTAKLTPDSLVKSCIQVLTIRDLADSAFPPSDAAFVNTAVKQLSTYRRQSVKLRDAQIGKILYDIDAFDDDQRKVLDDPEKVGHGVGVKGGVMAQGIDKIIGVTPQVTGTVDTYRGEQALSQDIDETLGVSANQAGTEMDTVRSASEVVSMRSGADARNKKERGRTVDFFLICAAAVDQLVMRYADEQDYIEIVGEDGTRRMMVWSGKILSGRYLYNISPDSLASWDAAQELERQLKIYNIVAADPLVDRKYLLQKIARYAGYDPLRMVLDPAAMMMQPPSSGATGEVVNAHEASNSGGIPNAPGAENKRENAPQNPNAPQQKPQMF